MADNDLIQQALSRGYSIDEIANRLSEDAGMSPADIRSRGYSSQEIIGTFGYSIPEVKQSMLDRAKSAVNWNAGRGFKVPEGQTLTDDSFTAGIPDIQNEKPKRNLLMENSIMRNSNGMPATEQTADLSSLPSVQKISTPSLQFERQKESNRKWLDNSKPLVVGQLMRDNNLSAEDAEIEFSRMRNAGVVPKATESGLREATWGEAFDSGIAKVKPSFDKSMAGLASIKSDVTGDFALSSMADALRQEANKQLAEADGILAGTSKDSWKKTISDAPASLAQNLPTVIAASALASNPLLAGVIGNIGLAGMGMISGGAAYAEGKDSGLNVSNNLQQSGLKALAEVIPEKMSLNVLVGALGKKAAEQAMKDSILQSAKTLGKYFGAEIGTEELTTIAQFGVDKMYSKPDMTMKDLVGQMIDTAKATLIQAPILGGTGILTKAAVDTAGRVVDPTGYQLRGWADAVDRTNFTPMQGGAENFDGYDQRMADVTANPFSRRMTRITQAEQTKQAAQAAIATAPTVDAAVDSFKVANAAGSASIVDQSALLNELTGNSGLDASIATADADAQALQAGIRDIDQHPTTLGERVSESGIPMGTQTGEQQATAHPMLEWLRNTSSDDVTTAVLANPALLQEIRPHVSDRVFQMISEDVAAAQSKTSAPALETATPPVQQAAPVPDVAGVVDVAETIKSLQSELSKAEPFSEQSSTITDKLHTAVHADAQSSLDAGEMPVYRVTDHVSVALHPSAQKEGMIQVTRYTKDGVIGDSQYNSVEEAIRNEGLIDRQRIDSAEAVKMIEQSIAAEADYQKRKSVEPIQPAIQATQQQGSTADGAIQPKPDLPEVTTVVPTFTPAAPPVAKSIKNWSANELQARLDRAASGESPLSAASEKTIREELNSRPSVQQSRKPIGLSIGVSPNAAEAVSVRSGVVYVGDYPAMDYETEADITVPDGATPQQIVAALRKGGAIASSSKVFGLAKAEKSDPLPKVDRKQIDPAKDSLFVAIAKLGGMDTQELLSNGFDQNDITYEVAGRVSKEGAKTGNYTKNTGRLGKKKRMPRMLGFNMPLHRNGGISFDGMLEALKQHGYFPEGATKNDAIEAFSRELGGEQVLTPEAVEAEMEAAQAARDAEIKASDEYDAQSDFEAETAAEIRAINAGYDALLEDEQAFVRGLKKHGASDEEINGYIAEFKRVREGNDAGAETSQSDSGTRSSEESDLHGESLGGKEGQAPEWLSTKRSEFRLEGQTNEQASEQKKEPELTKEQIDRERDGTPFTLEQESQPKPMGTQGSLFARQITADEQATVTNVADADLPANVKQTAAFLRVMSRILGKKIQWVSGANFDGMVKDSDTIYLNVDGDTNKVAVFGHEFWHQVEMTHKAVFDAVMKVVDPMFDLTQATQMFNDYFSKNASEAEVSAWLKEKNEQLSAQQGKPMTNRDFLIREFLSDTTGNRFTESDFWGDVFAKLEQREGHLKAVTLIRRFVKSLTDALNKLTNVLKMQGFRTDNDLTVEQIGRVKSALSEGMAQYLQDTRYGTKANGTVASGAKYSTQKDFTPDAELTAAAKKHFMLTMDVKEAGYIMPDGSMLDFSGKHYSSRSNWPYLRGQRNVDHRELTSENTHTNSTLESYFKTNDGNDIMEEFMSRTGAMRVDFNAGVSSIMRAPTDVQLKKLGQMKGWSATSYIDPDNGRIVADVEWDNTTPAKIRTFFAENVGKKAGDTAPKFSPMRTEITAVPMRSDEVAADKDNSHEYRLAVEKIAKERYASKPPVPVTINTTNEVVFISWGSASHILRDGLPDWKTSLAVLHMEGLIKSAERSGEFVPDYKGRKDPNGMYPYHSEAMIDGERHDVDITVRVHSDGHRYYDHIVVAKKTPAGLLESGDGLANSDAPTPPFTGADSNVAPDTPNNKYSPQRRFYSQLERTVEQTPDRIFATAPQFKLWLLANAGKFGIDKNELRESDFIQWLDEQKKVTKEEVKAKVSEGLPLFSRQRAKISDMADKDTVAGTQAPTSAGDESTGSAKQQIRIIPKWAAGEVYLRNADLRSHISLGPNNIFIRDDGRAIIDGNTVSPGDKLYLNSENKFVKEASAEDREKIAESLRYRIDQLVKESEGINRSVAKSSPSQSSGIDSGFDIFSENFRDPDEWKYARYPNARRGYAMDLLGLEAVDAISDKHDPEAIKQYVVDQYLRDKVFKVGGYLHIDDGQQVDGRLANAIYAYRAMGGRIGKSVLDAIGDKSYIKTYDLDPNEGVSIKDASDLSNVTELKPRNKPNEPSASAGSGVKYSRQRTQSPPDETKARFDLPKFGKLDQWQERVQDRYNRIRDVVAAVRKSGLVNDTNDFSMGEDRFHGVAMNRMEQIGEDFESLITDMKAADVTLDEVTLYAYAEHAPERNAAMQRINKDVETGSGMSDQESSDIIDKAKTDGKDKALSNLSAKMRGIAERTLKLQLSSGLITQSEYDTLTNKYQKWVPLRGFETLDEDGKTFRGSGKGFNIRGKENLRALGRDSKAGQILENIILDAERAAIRGTKNTEVNHRFLRFVLDNPDATLWEIDRTKMQQAMKNGKVSLDSLIDKGDNTIGVKVNGEVAYVKIHDDKLFEQLANQWEDIETKAIPYLGEFQKYLSKSYTAWSPEFAIYTNPVRDVQAALVSITGREGVGMMARFAKSFPKALAAAYRSEVLGKPDAWFDEYKAMGGRTGFWNTHTLQSKHDEIQALIKDMEGLKLRNAWRQPLKMAKALEKLISGHAGALENATRLASYMAMREAGRSKEQAAEFSKNLNVNFNRRGTWTPMLGSIFLFFNPAIQGTHNMYQTLTHGKHKKQAWALVGGGVMAMFALAMLNAGAGEDDDGVKWWDKIPDYEKERNIIIVIPSFMKNLGEPIANSTGRYIKFPMPYGWNTAFYSGVLAADVARNADNPAEGTTAGKGALLLGKSFATSFSPVTGLPPQLAPFYQQAANKKPFGEGQLYPDSPWNKHKPGSEKYSGSMKGSPWQEWASFVNSATGGNQYQEGFVSIPPAVWRNYARSFLGGPMSFGTGVVDSISEGDVTKAPFARKIYGEVGNVQDMAMYYRIADEAIKVRSGWKDAKKAGDRPTAEAIYQSNKALIELGGMAEDTNDRLGRLYKKDLSVKDDSNLTDAEKKLKLKINEKQRSDIQEQFLKKWRQRLETGEQKKAA